jgi:hypothetical protein
MNPRYTGLQVWNRQRKDEVLIDVADVALGHMTKMRWNEQGSWIYSEEIVHPPIISDGIIRQAQQLLAAKGARRVVRRPRSSPRPYVLRGLLFCGICERRTRRDGRGRDHGGGLRLVPARPQPDAPAIRARPGGRRAP